DWARPPASIAWKLIGPAAPKRIAATSKRIAFTSWKSPRASNDRLGSMALCGPLFMKRRDFLGVCAAPLFVSRGHAASPFPVKFRQEPPYASVLAFAEPGSDEFPGEKPAMELEKRLASALSSGDLPFAAACTGASPAPTAYRKIASDVAAAVFDGSGTPAAGWNKWRTSLGTV